MSFLKSSHILKHRGGLAKTEAVYVCFQLFFLTSQGTITKICSVVFMSHSLYNLKDSLTISLPTTHLRVTSLIACGMARKSSQCSVLCLGGPSLKASQKSPDKQWCYLGSNCTPCHLQILSIFWLIGQSIQIVGP